MNKLQPKSKDKYKLTNWREYNKGLKNRGKITIWIKDEVLRSWSYEGKRERGGKIEYSDLAIEICSSIKILFKLGYRQTEGFIESLFEIMRVDIPVPSYSQINRRVRKLKISFEKFNKEGDIDIVVDSTGLKVYGEGEWKVRKFGWSKHRTWRKLHLFMDTESQMILEEELTENNVSDDKVAEDFLDKTDLDLNSFRGDGGYDKKGVRKKLTKKKIKEIIPPQSNAVTSKDPALENRNKAIKRIKKVGRKKWKQEVRYHKRSRIEVAMFRYKTIIGNKISSRKFENEKVEVRLGCKILNKMTSLGMPKSIKVA
jgi:hypothetical protein